MEKNALGTTGLQLAALAVGYVRVVASAASAVPQDFLYNILRLLPALYGNLLELKPYGEDAGATDYDNYDTGAILPQVTRSNMWQYRLPLRHSSANTTPTSTPQ